MKQKIIHFIFAGLIIGTILFVSGCTEPTPVRPDTTQAFSVTDKMIAQSFQEGIQFLIRSSTENGFFIETINVGTNTTEIVPDILLQLQTLLDMSHFNDNSSFHNQHEQICISINQSYLPLNNTTKMQAFIEQSDSALLATISYLLQTNPGETSYDTTRNILHNVLLNRYMNNTLSSNSSLEKATLVDDCITLSMMHAINDHSEQTPFPDTLLQTIYQQLSTAIQSIEDTTQYYQILPLYIQTLYDVYRFTEDSSYVEDHIVLTQDLLPLQQDKEYLGHFLLSSEWEQMTVNTTYTAYCTQTICQAYILSQTLNRTTDSALFEESLFKGLYALVQMQENTTESSILGGFYSNHTKEIISLETIRPILNTYYLIETYMDNQSWTYLSDGSQGYLTIIDTEGQPMLLWYLLSAGVILSIIFLFILYGILRFIRKRKQ